MDCMIIKKRTKSSGITDLSNTDRKCSTYRKDLICTVCGAPAIGFNFAVITCMCCKAFFRRNALFGLPTLQCRYSTENCVINPKSRRDCSYCRLKKCFDVGMKKELILSEDLKRIKREKILANRQMTLNTIQSIDSLSIRKKLQMKETERTYLTNIYNAFEEYCRLPLITFERNEYNLLCQQPIKTRIKFQHYFQYYEKSESLLMEFFTRLPEFKQLPNDQQLALSKHNARFVMRISLIETLNDQLTIWPAINLVLETIFGKTLVEKSNTLIHQFKDQIGDSRCIRLLLVILLFSTSNTSFIDYINTLHIYKIQEKYIELLWLYLKQQYDELKACQTMSIIVRHCLGMQTIGHAADLKREELQKQNFFLSICD